MVGINVLTRCPYCGKLIYKNLGGTVYYNYRDREVRVESHDDCGKFITTDYLYENTSHFSNGIRFNKYFRPVIFRYVFENYDKDTLIEDYVENIINEIKEQYGKSYSEEEIESERNKVVSAVIDLIVKREEFDNDIFIKKLTEDVKKELVHTNTIFW